VLSAPPGSFILSLDSTAGTIQIEAKQFQEYLLVERLRGGPDAQ
jgi:hypothetical protein